MDQSVRTGVVVTERMIGEQRDGEVEDVSESGRKVGQWKNSSSGLQLRMMDGVGSSSSGTLFLWPLIWMLCLRISLNNSD